MLPSPPKQSPLTGNAVPSDFVHASTLHFQDTAGRTLLLRGVNLSGSAKCPSGYPQQNKDNFWESAEQGDKLSWINNPLNLDDGSADVHLARLRGWGWNTLRYVFTWEAIEHAGPGKHDHGYIDYVVKVLTRCGDYGFRVFMDPHQDVWSRFSGGSGAPIWTLHACNLQPRNFPPTYAALLQPFYKDPKSDSEEQSASAKFPAMIWSTNYDRLANLTMWTLFFAGRDFAPNCIIDGVNIQDWLLSHFLGSVDVLAKAIAQARDGALLDSVVIGWDSINEPAQGLTGRTGLSVVDHSEGKMHKGPTTSVLQEFSLGMGLNVTNAEYWIVGALGPSQKGTVDLDPKGVKVWMDKTEDHMWQEIWGYQRDSAWKPGQCIWAQHGVWSTETRTILKPDYFDQCPLTGSKVNFEQDYWLPHFTAYIQTVRRRHPEAIAFIQPPVFHVPPKIPSSQLGKRACYAPHFYDGLTLITRHWWWFNAESVGLLRGDYAALPLALSFGESRVRDSFAFSLRKLRNDVKVIGEGNEMPSLIGEIGIPYDLDDRKAYGYCEGGIGQGDYTNQQRALDASLGAADGGNMMNWTMWTYCPDNTHEYGDQWNMEDLSVWSSDDLVAEQLRSGDTEALAHAENNSSNSSTALLATATEGQQHRQHTMSVATTSSHANEEGNKALLERLKGLVAPNIVQGGSSIPPELLLNGARAVGAFCRPYPTATVGTPIDMHFNIRTSRFSLSIVVNQSSADVAESYTEIYVPFVHYAQNANAMSVDAAGTRDLSGPVHAKVRHNAKRGMSSDTSTELHVDIVVDLSEGRYELSGQYLRWWYDAREMGDRTVTIKITRKGGPIAARMEQSIPSWGDLCPIGRESCLIM